MLISETTTVIWNAKNKKHYVDRGYTFTKMRDKFEVSVDDLTVGSQAYVTFKCDYCGELYERQWFSHISMLRNSKNHSHCCGKEECYNKKSEESIKQIYGGYSGLALATKEKRDTTNLERYGCINPFSNDEVKKRIVETNMAKYGVPYNQQNETVRAKTIDTCREKYGVDHYVELFKGKYIKENSPCWKGGAEHSRVERATYEYCRWRDLVYARYQYRCAKCGVKSGEVGRRVELNAHHIMNWRDNPDLRYDISNGIALCDACHLAFHSKYGKRNNTRTQLDEFLSLDKNIC